MTSVCPHGIRHPWSCYECDDAAWWAHKEALASATGTAKTPQAVECEASQSGGRKPVTPTPDPLSNTHPNKGEDC